MAMPRSQESGGGGDESPQASSEASWNPAWRPNTVNDLSTATLPSDAVQSTSHHETTMPSPQVPQSSLEVRAKDSARDAFAPPGPLDAMPTVPSQPPHIEPPSIRPQTSGYDSLSSDHPDATMATDHDFLSSEAARFEEGLPLVSHSSDAQDQRSIPAESIQARTPAPTTSPVPLQNLKDDVEESAAPNPFGDSDDVMGDGADLFAGLSNNDEVDEVLDGEHNFSTDSDSMAPLSTPKLPLERKTTADVLNSLHLTQSHETHDSYVERRPSEDLTGATTGGGLAVSASTVISQVFGESGGRETADGLGMTQATGDKPTEDDLAAIWKAALDDDEFLDEGETPADAASFFPDDGEGFLEDTDDRMLGDDGRTLSPSVPAPVFDQHGQMQGFSNLSTGRSITKASQPSSSGRYTPSAAQPNNNPYSTIASATPALGPSLTPSTGVQTVLAPWEVQQHISQPRPELSQAQSFADKAKGGYSSPYDLPMDVTRPKKRPGPQPMARGFSHQSPSIERPLPPRSSSMNRGPAPDGGVNQTHPTSSTGPAAVMSPPLPGGQPVHTQGLARPQTASGAPAPNTRPSTSSFFEDLPVTAKPRHTSGRYTPQPSVPAAHPPVPLAPPQAAPRQQMYAPQTSFQNQEQVPMGQAPPLPLTPQANQQASYMAPHATQKPVPNTVAPITAEQLRAPERINPYADLSAPPQTSGAVPSVTSRYSPVPPPHTGVQSSSKYAAAPSTTTPPAPRPHQTHQPRTSSPLAHHTKSIQDSQGTSNVIAAANPGEPRALQSQFRKPSLPYGPPTSFNRGAEQTVRPASSRYEPSPSNGIAPPLAGLSSSAGPSQSHRGSLDSMSYAQAESHASLPPPRRSQTQSPGRMLGGVTQSIASQDPYARPASVHGPTSPVSTTGSFPPINGVAPIHQTRKTNHDLNYVVPTDGREHDPFQRWKGCPIFSWGFGGTAVTFFPKEVQRYNAGQAFPMVKMCPGEVKTRSIKEVFPLENHLATFPGPLKGKGKKKSVLAWLDKQIELFDQQPQFAQFVSDDLRRPEERRLLWRILRVLIANDGVLDGNPEVEKAVRAVLSPELEDTVSDIAAPIQQSSDSSSSNAVGQADMIHPDTVEQLRKALLNGQREKAVWEAVDKRMWGHAMLISSTLSRDLWKQVVQEFVRSEVKNMGDSAQSLAALYEVFAGNYEESVDELVPPSARAGFQMISKNSGAEPTKNALQGLDKWRETLGLILSNRSNDDGQALMALGRLLSGYGRVEAAHTCYMFARSYSFFGGADDPQTSIALLGTDHTQGSIDCFQELESILLSEVYEYGLTLSAASQVSSVVPHLQAYKLHHALMLAEFGYRSDAQSYCEAIFGSMKATTKPSPYYHGGLISALDDLTKRLHQSPSDGTSSWISKPTMGKISGSLATKFHSFVNGDDSETNSVGSGREGGVEAGPFAHIAGGTPVISRPASRTDLYGSYGLGESHPAFGGSGGSPADQSSASRYNPANAWAPRTSQEQPRPSLDGGRGSLSAAASHGSPSYIPSGVSPAAQQQSGVHPIYGQQPAGTNQHETMQAYQPQFGVSAPSLSTYVPTEAPQHPARSPYDASAYQSTQPHEPAQAFHGGDAPPAGGIYGAPQSRGGYEPPSSGYEPSAIPPLPSSSYHELQPTNAYDPPTENPYEPPTVNSYEPPSYQPYEPDAQNGDASPKEQAPKKKSFMDDDDDDFPRVSTNASKGDKAAKDKEAEENFRKAAAADAARDQQAGGDKKGWLSGWFGGKKDAQAGPGPIKAKLGEASSFYYDPQLKKWVNKKGGAEAEAAPTATPPPPRKGPLSRAVSGNGPSMASASHLGPTSAPSMNRLPQPTSAPNLSAPNLSGGPPMPQGHLPPQPSSSRDTAPTENNDAATLAPPGPGTASGPPSGPPSRPGTSMSMASSIDDLLGQPAARKGGTVKKNKKGRGYIDVMAK